MKLIDTDSEFPISSAVITQGRLLEAVVVGIRPNESKPVAGGAAAEMTEIFRQLEELLKAEGLSRTHIASVRLYLQHVNRDITEVNRVYRDYFGSHAPCRRAYGVDLQAGLMIEAAFVAEFP